MIILKKENKLYKFLQLSESMDILSNLNVFLEAEGDEDDDPEEPYNDEPEGAGEAEEEPATTEPTPATDDNTTDTETTDNNAYDEPYNDGIEAGEGELPNRDDDNNTSDNEEGNTTEPETTDSQTVTPTDTTEDPYNDEPDDAEDSENASNDNNETSQNADDQNDNDQPKKEAPPADFESNRKFILYKKINDLYNKIMQYQDRLNALTTSTDEDDVIFDFCKNRLTRLQTMIYDYIITGFKQRSYEDNVMFYQRIITSIQLVIKLLGHISDLHDK